MAEGPKYTVRPFSKPARTDLKDAFRVYLSPASLLQLRVRAGDACLLTSHEGIQATVIAWTAPEKIQDTVVQTSKTLQAACRLKLGEKLSLIKQETLVPDADTFFLADITQYAEKEEAWTGNDESHWEWYLEYILGRAEFITPGMVFDHVDLKGSKKSFRVLKARSSKETKGALNTLYKCTKESKVKLREPSPEEVQDESRSIRFEISSGSIGGLHSQVRQINERLSILNSDQYGLRMPHYYRRRGGILLYGPTGTGKTLLLNKLAALSWRKIVTVDSSIIGRYVGDSEASIRKLFLEARNNQPSLIVMDQLEVIATKSGRSESAASTNIPLTIASELDKLEGTRVFVAAATRKPNEIEESLRAPGRLQYEIEIPIPDANARVEILKALQGLSIGTQDSTSERLGERTHGYVGADLDAIIQLSAEKARSRYMRAMPPSKPARPAATEMDGLENGETDEEQDARLIKVSQDDIDNALLEIRPTAMREVFLEAPKVRWSDIGGQEEVKQNLREIVEWPFKYPERMKRLNIETKKGLLLYGPPGCSKTLTAKALATEAGLNFIAVKGAELISMYVGESERAIREVFRKARAASPSIIFFDEIDSIAASRDSGHQSSGLNVLTTLLNEMDGIEILKGVLVLAATNKPEILDPALMRPGRLDTILYVGPPDFAARKEILKIKTTKMDVSPEVDLDALAEKLEGYSGAEIVAVCERAGYAAFGECERTGVEEQIGTRHFEFALTKVVRQITDEVREQFENWSVGGTKKL
ncbi:AAA-domain-containing protein [Xylona heveae TC161]|uniref:AAA-domain-containing protein n=1 Tax=Xylona heveae (strain CBS 132557 / TC161) TaxID=1328760 RepID=A0A165FNT7_XYLHT|nr:AAA-domain-containing protein [Xylona heveae TC161]KZF21202.1 AAA-domain-containing protein [Xylona heveae TC161]